MQQKNEGKPERKRGRPFGLVNFKEEADQKKARKNSRKLSLQEEEAKTWESCEECGWTKGCRDFWSVGRFCFQLTRQRVGRLGGGDRKKGKNSDDSFVPSRSSHFEVDDSGNKDQPSEGDQSHLHCPILGQSGMEQSVHNSTINN